MPDLEYLESLLEELQDEAEFAERVLEETQERIDELHFNISDTITEIKTLGAI